MVTHDTGHFGILLVDMYISFHDQTRTDSMKDVSHIDKKFYMAENLMKYWYAA